MTKATLNRIIKLATTRRATALRRLEAAQLRGDDVRCDQLYSVIAGENELIENAQNYLKTL